MPGTGARTTSGYAAQPLLHRQVTIDDIDLASGASLLLLCIHNRGISNGSLHITSRLLTAAKDI